MSAQPAQPRGLGLPKPHLSSLWLRPYQEEGLLEEALAQRRAALDPAEEAAVLEALSPYCRPEAEPYSLPWFLAIEQARYGRHTAWLADFLGVNKHAGESVLCLGRTLGTDAVQFARHGARVIVCQSRWADLCLARRNVTLRHLQASFVHAEPTRLPLASTSIDVAVLTDVPASDQAAHQCVAEVFRVLRPGGKVLAVLPAARPSRWGWLRRGLELPVRQRTTPRALRRLFSDGVHARIKQRHLRTRNVIWAARWLPRSWLERLVGDFLTFKAFKPIQNQALRLAA